MENDVASIPAIATGWPAVRSVFFSEEGYASVAAVARFDPDVCLVEELHAARLSRVYTHALAALGHVLVLDHTIDERE